MVILVQDQKVKEVTGYKGYLLGKDLGVCLLCGSSKDTEMKQRKIPVLSGSEFSEKKVDTQGILIKERVNASLKVQNRMLIEA